MASEERDARWATVHVDPESLEPVELSERDLELLDEMGFSVERCWIEPGNADPMSETPTQEAKGWDERG